MKISVSYVVVVLGLFSMTSQGFAKPGSFVREHALQQAIADSTFQDITSILVAEDGNLVYEAYFGAGGIEFLNDSRSATKSLTAMAIGAAIMDGHIPDENAAAFAYFTADMPFRFTARAKDEITIQDLLTMSSALDCNDDVWASPGNEEHMYPARRWTYFVVDMPTREDYVRDANGFGPFSYCTAGSFLLGQIIQRATGEPVDIYIERRLLQPLGITRTHWDRSPSNEVMTGGGTELTSRALLQLAQLVSNGGMHGSTRLLPASWIDKMLTPHVVANETHNYGYQWWQTTFKCGQGTVDSWLMMGNGGNKVAVIKELNLNIVITAQRYSTPGMHQQSSNILQKYILPNHPQCQARTMGSRTMGSEESSGVKFGVT